MSENTKFQDKLKNEGIKLQTEESEIEQGNDLEGQVASLKDQLLRSAADYANMQRRLTKEILESEKRAKIRLTKEISLVLDHFYLCTERVAQEDRDAQPLKTFYEAINLNINELSKFLEKNNVTRFTPLGETFNPQEHEAVSQLKQDGVEPNIVVQVLNSGYKYTDSDETTIVKPAIVVVSV